MANYPTQKQLKSLLNNLSTSLTVSTTGGASQISAAPSPWVNSGIIGAGGSGGTGIFSYNEATQMANELVRKYEIYESKEDLLALSVCWKRLRDSNQRRFSIDKLLDKILFEELTQEDRNKADEIRDFYSKKIMIMKLKNTQLSNFRTDLNEFVHTDGKKFKECMMPLAYRLPEFYEYDKEFESFASEFNHTVTLKDQLKTAQTKTLKFVKNLRVNTKRFKRVEYWFSDEENNLVYMQFDPHNPLLTLLDKYKSEPFTILGHYWKKERDGREFLKIDGHKFV